MNNAHSDHRRWYQFRLRTLLVVVTLAAVASWAYWLAWPWWVIYHEKIDFESGIRKLRAGISTDAAIASLPTHKHFTTFAETQGHAVALIDYIIRDSVYRIYYVFLPGSQQGTMSTWSCDSLEVFRFPNMTKDGQYGENFKTFISGDRKHHSGFEYELIYSDPPR